MRNEAAYLANAEGSRLIRAITHLVVWLPAAGALAALGLALTQGVSGFAWLSLLVMYVLTVTGVELGLHRYVSHHAFRAHPVVEIFLVTFGSMAAQGGPLYWASTHRRHHAFSDRPGDPHSPHLSGEGPARRLTGMMHAHMGWLFQPVHSDWLRYVPDLIKDSRLFTLHRLYFFWVALGVMLPAVMGLVWTRSWYGALEGLLWGGLGRIFLVHHAVWGVNSLCHVFGSRPFATREQSRNLAWMALPSLGGAWHNNHHAFPRTADNRLRWWQFDFCGMVARILERTGLIRDVHYADPESFAAAPQSQKQPVAMEG